MGCILKAWGADFEVDRFLEGSDLAPYNVSHKGEPQFADSPNKRINTHSGLKVDVSEADFDDLQGQIADAICFLKRNRKELKRLRRFPGVEGACLDFAFCKRDVFCQCDTLPAELLYIAGLDIELSQFPAMEEKEEGA